MAHTKAVLKGDRLEFILCPSLRILLVFFVFGFDFFAEIAFALAFHIGLVLILAKMRGDIALIALIVEDDDVSAEHLSEHTS